MHIYVQGRADSLKEIKKTVLNYPRLLFQQPLYARWIGEELILSSNLTDWKPFLDFITGHVSVGLNIQDGQPSIVIGAKTNRRPNPS